MGIQNKLADGIDEVDIIIAGGKYYNPRLEDDHPEFRH